MLVLNRKKSQTVVVGDAVVTILDISGNIVRLGFSAPDNVKIKRGEITVKTGKTNPTDKKS
jgi:carbon storage regulator CsrA